MKEKLKKCPFCGKGNISIHTVFICGDKNSKTYQLHHWCPLFDHIRTGYINKRDDVIKAWNRRAK
jgi:hypothetical protein